MRRAPWRPRSAATRGNAPPVPCRDERPSDRSRVESVHEVLTAASARPIAQQLAVGVGAQLALLAALAAGLGLGAWSLAGLAYAVGLCVLLGAAARRASVRTLGP